MVVGETTLPDQSVCLGYFLSEKVYDIVFKDADLIHWEELCFYKRVSQRSRLECGVNQPTLCYKAPKQGDTPLQVSVFMANFMSNCTTEPTCNLHLHCPRHWFECLKVLHFICFQLNQTSQLEEDSLSEVDIKPKIKVYYAGLILVSQCCQDIKNSHEFLLHMNSVRVIPLSKYRQRSDISRYSGTVVRFVLPDCQF